MNSCSPLLSVSCRWVSDTRISVHGEGTNVIAEDIGLAWCIFLCEELNLLDSGILQCRACCMGQSHSSYRMFWRIPDHRCHKLHRVYTGLLHSAAQVSTALSALPAGRLEHRPGMTRSSSSYGLGTHTCLSHMTSGRPQISSLWGEHVASTQ